LPINEGKDIIIVQMIKKLIFLLIATYTILPLSAKNEAKTDLHDFVFYGRTELSPKEKALKEKQEKEEAKKAEKQKKEEKKKAEKAKTTQPSAEVPAPAPAKKPAYEKGELPAVAFIKPREGTPVRQPVILPIPPIEPYKSLYLLDYAELESEADAVPESAFNPNAGRYQFIANADRRDSEGRTLLMKAARSGNISMIENLLYSEADVNAADNDGWTALMFAARFQNNPKTIELLLNAGASMSEENNYGITALLLAAGFSHNTEVISSLLDRRSVAEKEVLAAFIYAVINQAPQETLQLFLEKGIAINAPYEGKTPLMYAAETNTDTKTLAWLLDNGARIRYKTSGGQTAFDYARANKSLPRDKTFWALNTAGGIR